MPWMICMIDDFKTQELSLFKRKIKNRTTKYTEGFFACV